MKKSFPVYLFFILILAYFVRAPCCAEGCFPDMNCCAGEGSIMEGYGVVGCQDGYGQTYCPLETIFAGSNCLVCECSSQESCAWETKDSNCGPCMICSYDSLISPKTTSCVAGYDCILGSATCLNMGEYSGNNCCFDNTPPLDSGNIDYNKDGCCQAVDGAVCGNECVTIPDGYSCAAGYGWVCDNSGTGDTIQDNCCYASAGVCDTNKCVFNPVGYVCNQGNGWVCDTVTEGINYDITKPTNCKFTDGGTYYYGCTANFCGATGWECGSPTGPTTVEIGTCNTCDDCNSNSICDFTELSGNDNDNDGILNDCDTEADETDCNDNIDNDGDGTCDRLGCSGMDPDDGCSDYCTSCENCGGEGFWDLCTRTECEENCGTNCYFYLPFYCCTDTDSDTVCNADDCCPVFYNPEQEDTDSDGIGNVCDICPNIVSPNTLSDDNSFICTATGEIECTIDGAYDECDTITVDDDTYFCNGIEWISFDECVYVGSCENGVYWLNGEACCFSELGCGCQNTADSCCNDADDDVCDPDCIAGVDPDCLTCTSSPGDCCEPSNDGTCDTDCPSGIDPDCAPPPTCLNTADDCCTGDSDGTCDPDCIAGVDPDCLVCTSSPGDCCEPSNDGTCDTDCPFGVDPDCMEGQQDPDDFWFICEQLEPGTQGNCDAYETYCWDQYANQCCGDDGSGDRWINSGSHACIDGTYYTDPDDDSYLCYGLYGYENCEHGEIGCWDPNSQRCCGDDIDETWAYSTEEKIDDILVEETCYMGRWYDRDFGIVTYYDVYK